MYLPSLQKNLVSSPLQSRPAMAKNYDLSGRCTSPHRPSWSSSIRDPVLQPANPLERQCISPTASVKQNSRRSQHRLPSPAASKHHNILSTLPEDPKTDPRTGLQHETTKRHLQLLQLFNQAPPDTDPWTYLMTQLEILYPNPSSQKTFLSSAIGAVKRAHTYGVEVRGQSAPHPQMVQDRINALSRRVRLAADHNLPGVEMQDLQQKITSLSPETQIFTALSVLTGGHRGTSIRDLLTDDILLRLPPKWLDVPPCQTSNLLVTLRFRDGKTNNHIGTYAVHFFPPEDLLQRLIALMKSSPNTYLFGITKTRNRIYDEVSRAIHFRDLRRGILRFLAWDCGFECSDIRLNSRHTDNKQLYQYLGGGAHASDEAQRTTTMSSNLFDIFSLPTTVSPNH